MGGQPVWIAADDGTRLCADLYLPPGDGPWPVLLEALPYRVHDVSAAAAARDRALAAAGFAVCRLDLRGTGSSGGIADDEHPDVERDDLRRAIAWLCAQPWCTGRAGMFGTSYSGSSALLMAAAGVPGLGAVVVTAATDDRYTDGAHHAGGVLRAIDLVADATRMVAMNALPPVPAVYGDGWDDAWRQRIDATEPWVLGWLRAQADGSTWRRGSVRLGPDGAGYERIACPTMLIADSTDGDQTTAFRTVAHLRVPWRLLAGPWHHAGPSRSDAGPTGDVDDEVIAFFDAHLRGGHATDTAAAHVFVRRPARPEPDRAEHPGAWRQAGTWPPPGWRREVLTPARTDSEELDVVADVGVTAGGSAAGARPVDQRVDDARSLTHDWSITAPAELAGAPSVRLRVRSSAP
ncbi:MAG TPA: CocE/NonD family hydrolase, partial [Ornithinibacter sp.]|nr:CocE/NonD family hydrolase [Ornithinibacter sp.]